VHKATLRRFCKEDLSALRRLARQQHRDVIVAPGQTAWALCNAYGASLSELRRLNKGAWRVGGCGGGAARVALAARGAALPPPARALLQALRISPPATARARTHAGVNLEDLAPGQVVRLPAVPTLAWAGSAVSTPGGGAAGVPRLAAGAATAVAHAMAVGDVAPGGVVAVKVQYPDALSMMAQGARRQAPPARRHARRRLRGVLLTYSPPLPFSAEHSPPPVPCPPNTPDLRNLRAAASFLQRTELKFDLVSAVTELQAQIGLEFDFGREAAVMDAVADHLAHMRRTVTVPRRRAGASGGRGRGLDKGLSEEPTVSGACGSR